MIGTMRLTKKLFIFLTGFLVSITLLASSCFDFGVDPPVEDPPQTSVDNAAEESPEEDIVEDEIESLFKSDDFMEMFNSFYYPDSEVLDAKFIEENKEMIFLLLEAEDDFFMVEDFYMNKRVQSIWSRDLFFEKSIKAAGEEGTDPEDEYILVSKFTYSSKDKDKIVDVLIKNLGENRTQVMITYWNLQ